MRYLNIRTRRPFLPRFLRSLPSPPPTPPHQHPHIIQIPKRVPSPIRTPRPKHLQLKRQDPVGTNRSAALASRSSSTTNPKPRFECFCKEAQKGEQRTKLRETSTHPTMDQVCACRSPRSWAHPSILLVCGPSVQVSTVRPRQAWVLDPVGLGGGEQRLSGTPMAAVLTCLMWRHPVYGSLWSRSPD